MTKRAYEKKHAGDPEGGGEERILFDEEEGGGTETHPLEGGDPVGGSAEGSGGRRRWLWWLVGTVLAGILTGGGYFYFFQGQGQTLLFRIPGIQRFLKRELVSLRPFIVPSESPRFSYHVVSVKMIVAKNRKKEVMRRLAWIRKTIFLRLPKVRNWKDRCSGCLRGVRELINSRLGASAVYRIWVVNVRTI